LHAAFKGQKAEKMGRTPVLDLENGSTKHSVQLMVADLQDDDFLIGTDLFQQLGYGMTGIPVTWPDQEREQENSVCNEQERDEMRMKVDDENARITKDEKDTALRSWKPLLQENAEIKETEACSYPGAVLNVDTGEAEPIFIRQYPTPRRLEEKITQRVKE
jgi:hypothetical protein